MQCQTHKKGAQILPETRKLWWGYLGVIHAFLIGYCINIKNYHLNLESLVNHFKLLLNSCSFFFFFFNLVCIQSHLLIASLVRPRISGYWLIPWSNSGWQEVLSFGLTFIYSATQTFCSYWHFHWDTHTHTKNCFNPKKQFLTYEVMFWLAYTGTMCFTCKYSNIPLRTFLFAQKYLTLLISET